LAAHHQYRDDHCHFPDGLSHPKHPKPRFQASQLKLDELIRSVDGARNRLMDLEALSDDDLDKFQKELERLRKRSERTAETVSKVGRKLNSR